MAKVSPESGGEFGAAPAPPWLAVLAAGGAVAPPRGPLDLTGPEVGHDGRELGMHSGFLSVADTASVTMSYDRPRHIGRTQPVARARALPRTQDPLPAPARVLHSLICRAVVRVRLPLR